MVTAHSEIKGRINEQVFNTVTDLIADVIGRPAVNLVLKRCSSQGELAGEDLMYAFAQEIQSILGDKGSYATLRQVGRALAKHLMTQYPQEEWTLVLETALNHFGYASGIEKCSNRAFICNCVFYDKLAAANIQPTRHAVCWTGWGFIEGFMKGIEGIKSIQWIARDVENRKCNFEFLH